LKWELKTQDGNSGQKTPKKHQKVLKMKSVDAGITPFFLLGKFLTCSKNGGENKFFAQKLCKKNTLKTKSVNSTRTLFFFPKVKFHYFEIMV